MSQNRSLSDTVKDIFLENITVSYLCTFALPCLRPDIIASFSIKTTLFDLIKTRFIFARLGCHCLRKPLVINNILVFHIIKIMLFQRRIQNPAKHLRWNANYFSKKNWILDVWQGSEYPDDSYFFWSMLQKLY